MELFDQFEKEGTNAHHLDIVRKGYISKMISEYYEEI